MLQSYKDMSSLDRSYWRCTMAYAATRQRGNLRLELEMLGFGWVQADLVKAGTTTGVMYGVWCYAKGRIYVKLHKAEMAKPQKI